MKLLVVYPYVPYPLDRGTFQRTYHLLVELAKVHEVSFVALAESGEGIAHADLFRQFCQSVEFIPFVHPPWPKLFPERLLNPVPTSVLHWKAPHIQKRLDEILRKQHYDAVHVCDIVMAQYFLRHDVPLFMDRSRVDLQFQLAEHGRMNYPWRTRLLRGEGYLKMWAYERKVARRATLEIVCGPDDETFLRRWVSRRMRVEVLTNGVNLDYFGGDVDAKERAPRPTIIFCGAMDYNPNIDALRWYFAEMHEALRKKAPELQVLIVGKAPVNEVLAYGTKPGVTVTGGVPDVRPYYRQAWMHIVPLRIGGGTRLKIIESLAIGTPVISTTIGAQGLGLENNRDILLADDAPAFVAKAAEALENQPLRQRLSRAGMETANRRFSWTTIGQKLNALYEERLRSQPVLTENR